MKNLIPVAVVGPKDKLGFSEKIRHDSLVGSIIEYFDAKYGSEAYYIITINSDSGFGRSVRDICRVRFVRLVQLECYLSRNDARQATTSFGPPLDLAILWNARHAMLMELAREVFVVQPKYRSTMDDLLQRLRKSEIPYYLYDDELNMIEQKGDPAPNVQVEKQTI